MCALHLPRCSLLRPARLISPVSCLAQQTQDFHEARRPTRIIKKFKDGENKWDIFKQECVKFKDEWKQALKAEHVTDMVVPKHNDFQMVYSFADQNDMDKWRVSTDADSGVGHSSAEFTLGQNKTAIFRGNINTEAPKDGIVTKTGFANIRALAREEKSFLRQVPATWARFTHLVVKVRGDGRPYNIVLGMQRDYDVQWNDQFMYPLYTRGGPYWQISKIPFNKFYLAYKGRIPDKQAYVDLQNVLTVGITIADGVDGPFQLELDWVGVVYDETHNDTFVYESYDQKQYFLT